MKKSRSCRNDGFSMERSDDDDDAEESEDENTATVDRFLKTITTDKANIAVLEKNQDMVNDNANMAMDETSSKNNVGESSNLQSYAAVSTSCAGTHANPQKFVRNPHLRCTHKGGRRGRHDVVRLQKAREIQDISHHTFMRELQVTYEMVNNLEIAKSLSGHCGCVNCIQFSADGSLLLSGSDDYQVILWSAYHQKKLKTLSTSHTGNIFSVQFMPQTGDSIVISGAGDGKIEVREVETGETCQVYTSHFERVKRLATDQSLPHLFFSASEDGTVMLFDTRVSQSSGTQANNVLVNLKQHSGKGMECKCLAIDPFRPELLAVGANDPFVRVYDRRMIKPTIMKVSVFNLEM